MRASYFILYAVLATLGVAQKGPQGPSPQQGQPPQQGPRQQGPPPQQGQQPQQGPRQQGPPPQQGQQGGGSLSQPPRQQGPPPQQGGGSLSQPPRQQGPPPQQGGNPPQQGGNPPAQHCGKTLPSCPNKFHCQKIDTFCFDISFQGGGCIGQCVADRPGAAAATPAPKNDKPKALGFLKCPDSAEKKCGRGTVCIPSMRTEGQVMCVAPDDDCGQARFFGNLGTLSYKACPAGKVCVADPKDGCPGGVCNSTNGLCITP